eukprot:jgi/Tetstr1/444428/TSEL_032315.t1
MGRRNSKRRIHEGKEGWTPATGSWDAASKRVRCHACGAPVSKTQFYDTHRWTEACAEPPDTAAPAAAGGDGAPAAPLPQLLAGLNRAFCDAEHHNIIDVSQYTAHMNKRSTRFSPSRSEGSSNEDTNDECYLRRHHVMEIGERERFNIAGATGGGAQRDTLISDLTDRITTAIPRINISDRSADTQEGATDGREKQTGGKGKGKRGQGGAGSKRGREEEGGAQDGQLYYGVGTAEVVPGAAEPETLVIPQAQKLARATNPLAALLLTRMPNALVAWRPLPLDLGGGEGVPDASGSEAKGVTTTMPTVRDAE